MRSGHWAVDCVLVKAGQAGRARGRQMENGSRLRSLEVMTTSIFKAYHTSLVIKVASSCDRLGSIDSVLYALNVG